MKVSKIFKKAMVDKEIKGFKQLSIEAGISYKKTLLIMGDQSSAKFVDVEAIAECLGLKLHYVISGDICTTTSET